MNSPDPVSSSADAGDQASNAALADLHDRLSRHPDLPSLAGLLPDIRRLARCDRARIQALSGALLKDIGLSHRLLRLVNAAYYRGVGGGSIATVTRAVAVMGFDAIGRLAVGARLVESASRGSPTLELREECLRAMLAATLADLLSPGRCPPEDAYLAALFRNLGRLLAALHRPQELRAVRGRIDPSTWPRGGAEELGARQAFGTGYSEIGRALASQWGWPAPLRDAMYRSADGSPPARTAGFGPVALAALCDDLADALIYRPTDQLVTYCEHIASRRSDGPSARELQAVAEQARLQLGDLARALDLSLARLPAWGTATAGSAAPPVDDLPAAIAEPVDAPRVPLAGSELLAVAIQDLSATLLGGPEARAAVPAMVLESLWRGLGARRAVLCRQSSPGGPLVGTMSLGPDGDDRGHERFRIDPTAPQDLFAMLCRRGADTLIDDVADPRIAARLSPWFLADPAPPQRLLVLPMTARGAPVGLIVLDGRRDGDLRPDEQALRLARTLRNQLTLALENG